MMRTRKLRSGMDEMGPRISFQFPVQGVDAFAPFFSLCPMQLLPDPAPLSYPTPAASLFLVSCQVNAKFHALAAEYARFNSSVTNADVLVRLAAVEAEAASGLLHINTTLAAMKAEVRSTVRGASVYARAIAAYMPRHAF
jgi:hypothetical protein